MKGYLYLIESPNCKRPYLGSSSNLGSRIKEHNKGTTKATKNKGPWSFILSYKLDNIQDARRVEYIIKKKKIKLTRGNIAKMIKQFEKTQLVRASRQYLLSGRSQVLPPQRDPVPRGREIPGLPTKLKPSD